MEMLKLLGVPRRPILRKFILTGEPAMVVSQFQHALRIGLAAAASMGSIAVAQDGIVPQAAAAVANSPTINAPAAKFSLVSSSSGPNFTAPSEFRREIGSLQDRPAEIASPSDLPAANPLPSETTQILSSTIRVSNISTSEIGSGRIPPAGNLPGVQTGLPDGVMRGSTWKCVHWAPAAICHYPLYFEDAMLERHGHQKFCRLQPLISGTKFFATLPVLPYKQALQGPLEPTYTLGHYRTGTPAPALRQRLPWDRNAAAIEALSLGGLFWAAPL